MALRTVIYNFIKEQSEIIDILEDQGVISIVEWFCYPPHGTVNIKNFADVKYRINDTYGLGEEIYKDIYKSYSVFSDMHQRRYRNFQNTIYDTQSDFNIQFGAIYSLLTVEKPELIIFGNIPHGGHDYLLYKIAETLKIHTLILFQVPVCPKFFILNKITELGHIKQTKRKRKNTITEEKLPEITTPFYMKSEKIKLNRYIKSIRRILGYNYTVYSIINKIRKKQYQNNLKSLFVPLPDSVPYIYFPLHLQPEMTTSSLGSEYIDQMLAIERLSRKLPKGMIIVVKENPKQTDYQRPNNFFERLQAVPSAILVDTNLDTFSLIKNSMAIATITGTAGWEAINMGKPAIIFGVAWYESLPGVVKYHSDINIIEVMNISIKKLDLEKKYNILLSNGYPGIISSPYFTLDPGVNISQNNMLIAHAIKTKVDQIHVNL